MAIRALRPCAGLLLALAVGARATDEVLDEGGACLAAGGEGCAADDGALELRQLRSRAIPAMDVEGAELDPKVVPPEGGVPGGWGEPAEYMKNISSTESGLPTSTSVVNQSDNESLGADWWWPGSCGVYGCVGYTKSHHCQCNPTCVRYKNCCVDFWLFCNRRPPAPAPAPPPPPPPAPVPVPAPAPTGGLKRVMTLYHQTSGAACNLILQTGFRPGTRGWCGGGIYFATTPEDTFKKAIGADSAQGCILQAEVDVGRVKEMPSNCDSDLTGDKLVAEGFDSVIFNPGDGPEYIVYAAPRVLSIKRYVK